METSVTVTHIVIKLKKSFEQFTNKFETILGKLDMNVVGEANSDIKEKINKINSMRGEHGLMIFNSLNHGLFLALTGRQEHVVVYEIGNPLGSVNATGFNLATTLYIPFRITVYESPRGDSFAEYDLPSSLLSQFRDKSITAFALKLDIEIETIIKTADQIGESQRCFYF